MKDLPLFRFSAMTMVLCMSTVGCVNMRGRYTSPDPEVFALIPAGTFIMGSPNDEPGRSKNEMQKEVTLTRDFYLQRTLVTWAQWKEVREWAILNGYTDISAGLGKEATHPVVRVNWWDVVKWCNARSEKEGLTPVYRNADGTVFKVGQTVPTADWNANGYRLPTEAEWERAARGGSKDQLFPWGDEINHSHANYLANGSAFKYDTSPYTEQTYHPSYVGPIPCTSPVGSFAPNGYGLYDIAGNADEWLWDWYSSTSAMGGSIDPKGATSGLKRVFRGSSWVSSARTSRTARRLGTVPTARFNHKSFRPARSSVPQGR